MVNISFLRVSCKRVLIQSGAQQEQSIKVRFLVFLVQVSDLHIRNIFYYCCAVLLITLQASVAQLNAFTSLLP